MIGIARHIEVMLLKHDCVVVPSLGGFVTQYVSANYVEEEGIILPPTRVVCFNPNLLSNDGLLVQSYMEAYNCDYNQGLSRIESEVATIREIIKSSGEFVLEGIGVLQKNNEGTYNFSPIESGVSSPWLYALDLVEVSCLDEVLIDDAEDDNLHDEKYYNLRVNRNLVNYVAASVIAVLFYFLWTPIGDVVSSDISVASFVPTKVENVQVQDKPLQVPKDISLDDKSSIEKAEVEQIEISDEYCVVMASAISKKNATAFVEELKAEGYENARMLQTSSMIRVIIGGFNDMSRAQEFIQSNQGNCLFESSWAMKL